MSDQMLYHLVMCDLYDVKELIADSKLTQFEQDYLNRILVFLQDQFEKTYKSEVLKDGI